MRLIDADILLGYVNKYDTGQPIGKALRAMLEKSPTVDAVPVIRCKDCIRWRKSNFDTTVMVCDWDRYENTENDYCSWAKRKDDDTR